MRDLSVVSVSGRSALLNYILKIVHKDDDLDESVSLLVYASSYNLNMCTLKLRFLQKEPMLRQTRKATKKPPSRCGHRCVDMYSHHNAAGGMGKLT